MPRIRLALSPSRSQVLPTFPTRRIPFIKIIILAVIGLSCTVLQLWRLRSDIQQRQNAVYTGLFQHAENDNTHRLFRSSTGRGLETRTPARIRAYDAMSDECVEQWVVHGRWGASCIGTDLSEGLKLDGVWAWVNGSDPLQVAARQRYRPSSWMTMDAAHRFTEHNELLYSMRSAVASLGEENMPRLHILASAYPLTNNGSEADMVGQVPAWLDKEQALSRTGRTVLHHDADYFRPNQAAGTDLTQDQVQQWREASIPSFSSLAVESQIHNIDGAVSDQIVYYNDDFFTMRKLAVSDYTTPLYGPVIKTTTSSEKKYHPAETTIYRTWKPAGERHAMTRAAWILGSRFGMRPWYYITHHPRTLWLPLLREAAQTFPEAFSNTPLSRFRAQVAGPASIQAIFLCSWYIVERHREALLWSWAVAKWGGESGIISPQSKDLMWEELAGGKASPSSERHLHVGQPVRIPVENTEVFEKANISIPTSTEYSFSSKDGYALSYVDSMWYWDRPRHGYPDLTHGLIKQDQSGTGSNNEIRYDKDPGFTAANVCEIDRLSCFGPSESELAGEFFKRVAFGKSKCGDCIITALIGASGVSGIDKFLPNADTVLQAPSDSTVTTSAPPHLPLTSEWSSTDFSMDWAIPTRSIRAGMTLRTWCTRLIQRYSYVLGSAASDFYMVERAGDLESKLDEVERQIQKDLGTNDIGFSKDLRDYKAQQSSTSELEYRWRYDMGDEQGPLAYLCLNDDIKESGSLRVRVDRLLSNFFRRTWTKKLDLERHPQRNMYSDPPSGPTRQRWST